jgi:hypothetical protein
MMRCSKASIEHTMETHHEQVHRCSDKKLVTAPSLFQAAAIAIRPALMVGLSVGALLTMSNFVQLANAQQPNTAREQALRECSLMERRDTLTHGKGQRPAATAGGMRPSRIDPKRESMPRTCQALRSLDKCSEHDRVPGVPPPRVRSRPACLPRKPAALPHCPVR